jgi:hypothetical protein
MDGVMPVKEKLFGALLLSCASGAVANNESRPRNPSVFGGGSFASL